MECNKIRRSTQSDLIPPELIIEILSRLPAKSIARFRSVSKLWSSITTTPCFIKLVASRSGPCVVLMFSMRDKLFVFSSPLLHQTNNTYYPPVENYQFTIPNNGYSFMGLDCYYSVHGLICMEASTGFLIWNPITKQFFTLPVPECNKGKAKTSFLGYDPIDGIYKLLYIFRDDKIGILTLGAHESWRIMAEGFPRYKSFGPRTCGICINGVIYYEGLFGSPRTRAIMSFDVRSEKFTLMKYPRQSYSRGGFFISYHGRLALVISPVNSDSGVELWILEDAENHHWICKHFPSPSAVPPTEWKLKGVTNAGEFMYVYTSTSLRRTGIRQPPSETGSGLVYELFRILYFDPVENSYREARYRGVAVRDDNGKPLGDFRFNKIMRDFSVLPNHIDNMSICPCHIFHSFHRLLFNSFLFH